MIVDELIAFSIPTYNRSLHLDFCLERLIDAVERHKIKIYISDNCSSDNTREIVNKWQEKYKYLYYSCNETNVDMDGNFEKALSLPSTRYVWLFGDTYEVERESIDYLIQKIMTVDFTYDCLVFNLENIIKKPTKNYTEQNELLIDLSGIMSCVSCLVYSKDLIESACFSRYRNTFFSLEAVIFEYIDNKDFLIHWSQEESVKNLQIDGVVKKNWSNSSRMFEIGIHGWLKFIYSLPASYSLESKYKAEKLYVLNSGLLNYREIIVRRIDGAININILLTNYRKIIRVSGYAKFLYILILCCIPKTVMKKTMFLLKELKRVVGKIRLKL